MTTNNSINLKETGIASYDGAGTFHGRSLAQPAAGITISNSNGVGGNPTFALADDLAAVEGLSTTGLATRTATSTWTTRTITAGTGISISNGDGVSGNPTISATSSVPIIFTEDSGTATPSSNNINIFGTSAQGISTAGSGSTVTITAADATSLQKGVAKYDSTNFTVSAGNVTSNAITMTAGTGLTGGGSINLGGSVSFALSTPVTVPNGGTGATTLTQYGSLYGNGVSAIGATAAGTNGQVLIAATGAAPAFATLGGSNGISYTAGPNSLTISNSNIPNSALQNSSITVSAGAGISVSGSPVSLGGTVTISASASVPTTFNADTGSATPALNVLTLAGTSAQGLSTSATGSTVTFTNADWTTLQKGVGTLATNAETIAGTVTNKAVTPDDLKAKLGTQTAHGLPIGAGTSSAFTWTANPTAGQLLIGVANGSDPVLNTLTQPAAGITINNGAGSITFALANDLAAVEGLSTTGLATRTATDTWTTRTLTAGTGISITNGDGVAGNPTISVTGAAFTWNDENGNFNASSNAGYFCTAALTATLPPSPTQGDAIAFICDTGSTVTVTANTGQKIRIGSAISALAGTAASATQGNSLTLIYRSTGATWFAQDVIGVWSVT